MLYTINMKITVVSLALLTGLLTGCSGYTTPPRVSNEVGKPGAVKVYPTSLWASDIMRVPIKEDGVICYIAVESNQLKSVNCIKVDDNAGK